jgi:hypothetical protein
MKGCPWFSRFGVGHEATASSWKTVYVKKNLMMNAGLIIRKLLGKCYARTESDKVVTKGK